MRFKETSWGGGTILLHYALDGSGISTKGFIILSSKVSDSGYSAHIYNQINKYHFGIDKPCLYIESPNSIDEGYYGMNPRLCITSDYNCYFRYSLIPLNLTVSSTELTEIKEHWTYITEIYL